jgi:MscS family membrane protein
LVANILLAYEKPLRGLFVVIGIYLALWLVPLDGTFRAFIDKVFRSNFIILLGWGLINLGSTSSRFFVRIGGKFNIAFDKILLPFIAQLFRLIVVLFAISMIAGEWGFNVGGFVAGLGLGGLAIALAAQDSIKNFIGGIVIIIEKPFTIGDWIKTPSVEGTVENITFRSTKVRTFAQALVTVPNSNLANDPITNWSKMGKRQITFSLGLAYTTPRKKIQTCVERIDHMLRKHADVDQETIYVRFKEFSESSLEIYLNYFTKTTTFDEFLRVRENINYLILEILEEENVSVALPSQSIFLNQSSSFVETVSRKP